MMKNAKSYLLKPAAAFLLMLPFAAGCGATSEVAPADGRNPDTGKLDAGDASDAKLDAGNPDTGTLDVSVK